MRTMSWNLTFPATAVRLPHDPMPPCIPVKFWGFMFDFSGWLCGRWCLLDGGVHLLHTSSRCLLAIQCDIVASHPHRYQNVHPMLPEQRFRYQSHIFVVLDGL